MVGQRCSSWDIMVSEEGRDYLELRAQNHLFAPEEEPCCSTQVLQALPERPELTHVSGKMSDRRKSPSRGQEPGCAAVLL